jgi:hypothetical protein
VSACAFGAKTETSPTAVQTTASYNMLAMLLPCEARFLYFVSLHDFHANTPSTIVHPVAACNAEVFDPSRAVDRGQTTPNLAHASAVALLSQVMCCESSLYIWHFMPMAAISLIVCCQQDILHATADFANGLLIAIASYLVASATTPIHPNCMPLPESRRQRRRRAVTARPARTGAMTSGS